MTLTLARPRDLAGPEIEYETGFDRQPAVLPSIALLNDPVRAVLLLRAWADAVMASRPPNEIIQRGAPYIERWYLARKAAVPFRGGPAAEAEYTAGLAATMIPSEIENAYLHRYCRSDREPMHDHPWANGTLVLSGQLVEQVPEGFRTLRTGDVVLRRADQAHALIDARPGTTTLFVTLRKERDWGFLTPDGWESWRTYRPMFRDAEARS